MTARRARFFAGLATLMAAMVWCSGTAFAGALVDQIPPGRHLVGTVPSYDAFGSSEDNRVADDFTVPAGRVFHIDAVHATGYDAEGSGSATVDVFFYTDSGGLPGDVIYSTNEIPAGTCAESTQCIFEPRLTTQLRLTPGNYWVSVQASGFVWRQKVTPPGPPLGAAAVWENPNGGLGVGCLAWTPVVDCSWTNASNGTDLWYQLLGQLSDSRFTLGHFSRNGDQLAVAGSFASDGSLSIKGSAVKSTKVRINAGNREVKMQLKPSVQRDLTHGDRVRVHVQAVFTAGGGVPYRQHATVTLKPN
jgi:hypothetical protein